MSWYIGQEIACIETHPNMVIKEGELHVIKSLRQAWCGCNHIEIFVGIKHPEGKGNEICVVCGNKRDKAGQEWFFHEKRFTELDKIDISELAVCIAGKPD